VANKKNNAMMGSASKAAGAGEMRLDAGDIRFGSPEINIGSDELLTVSITLSATFTIRLILGHNLRHLILDFILIIRTM
jgi:hypothetical protein